jgi:outer membrane protein assembly factor BamB
MLSKTLGNMLTYIAVIIFIAMFQVAAAQECQFQRAFSDKDFDPTKFWFERKGEKVLIDNYGNGEAKYSNGIIKKIKLVLPTDFYIETLQVSACLDDIIMVCQLSDGDCGCGRAYRLDRNRLRVKWMAEIRGFNVGEALLQNNYLYLTSISWVGKLDVSTGKYKWQIDHLYTYPPGWYNAFEKPFIKEGKVYFPEINGGPRKRELQTLIVDDKTGKILGGAPPKGEK